MANRYTAEQVAQALKDANGIVRYAAQRLGCSRLTVYNYMKKYASVKQAHEDARENQIDYVEGKLLEQINSGNITAIIFYLKTQAKHRGYTERQEVTGADGGAQEFKLVYPDD